MNEHALKQLVAQGLAAFKSGSQIDAQAADEIENDAGNPELKAALQQGAKTAEQWATRIDQASQEASGADDDDDDDDNPILEAHYEVSKRIRGKAPDDFSRDLGIVAASQLALHYWITSFGTIRAYAKRAGLSQTQQLMEQSLEEAEKDDKQFTDIAINMMS